MWVYEVGVRCERAEDASSLPAYMTEKHIPEILATGVFAAATFERDTVDPLRFRTRYHAKQAADIDRYMDTLAPRFREDFAPRYPGARVERSIWEIDATF